MTPSPKTPHLVAAVVASLALAVPAAAGAADSFVGVTDGTKLVQFHSDTLPGLSTPVAIGGLPAGEQLVALDRAPPPPPGPPGGPARRGAARPPRPAPGGAPPPPPRPRARSPRWPPPAPACPAASRRWPARSPPRRRPRWPSPPTGPPPASWPP